MFECSKEAKEQQVALLVTSCPFSPMHLDWSCLCLYWSFLPRGTSVVYILNVLILLCIPQSLKVILIDLQFEMSRTALQRICYSCLCSETKVKTVAINFVSDSRIVVKAVVSLSSCHRKTQCLITRWLSGHKQYPLFTRQNLNKLWSGFTTLPLNLLKHPHNYHLLGALL
jgi:hypothetical protein